MILNIAYRPRIKKKEIDRDKLAKLIEVSANNSIFFSNQIQKTINIEKNVKTVGKTYFDRLNTKQYERSTI